MLLRKTISNRRKIIWDNERGFINLITDSAKERLFLIRTGFNKAFADEIVRVSGKMTLSMILWSLFEELGLKEGRSPR